MPEYLAPGIYIEEISIGAKPIEGVSTSTAGFVGMTERGPLNTPTLVTSFAEYQRVFGGYLGETFGDFRFLPYAVEGFFKNGGKRAYISRVALDEVAANQLKLDDAGKKEKKANKAYGSIPSISGLEAYLKEGSNEGDITIKTDRPLNLDKGNIYLLKGKSPQEFLEVRRAVKVLKLDHGLKSNISASAIIVKLDLSTVEVELVQNCNKNSLEIVLDGNGGLKNGDPFKIIEGTKSEICIVDGDIENNSQNKKVVPISSPLKFGYNIGSKVTKLIKPNTNPISPSAPVKANRSKVPIEPDEPYQIATGDPIKIENDYFLVEIDNQNMFLIADELKYGHPENEELKQLIPIICVEAANEGTWGNQIKIVAKESSISRAKLISPASIGQKILDLDTIIGMEKGTMLKLPGTEAKYASISEVINNKRVNLKEGLDTALKEGDEVSTVEFNLRIIYNEYEEVYSNLSLDKDHSRYLEKIFKYKPSSIITVKDNSNQTAISDKILMPTQDKEPGWKLSNGNDGIPLNDKAEPKWNNVANIVYRGMDNDEPTKRTGIHALKSVDDISIIAMPGVTPQILQSEIIDHCGQIMKDRFAVLDSEKQANLEVIKAQRNLYDSEYAALYYPWIRVFDPLSGQQIDVPPSGHVCGIYARSDNERGVHKAPANEVVSGALDLEELPDGRRAIISKGQQDILNPKGINCIRSFHERGIRVWGARTISSDSSWKYVNVRRLFLFVEKSIEQGTQWVVFEPNDEKLWSRVKQSINQFLTSVWKDGALMGATQDEAFFARCDRTTMTQADIDNGRLIVLIGIAPVKPAEFVIFRIAQVAKGSEISA